MAEDVVVQTIMKSLGPSVLEYQGMEWIFEAIYQYSSLTQPSCLHRNDKPWGNKPGLVG